MSNINPAARLLGRELHSHRTARRLSGDQVAIRLRWSPSKVSRQENARLLIAAADLDKLISLYRVPAGEAARLRGLHAAAAAGREAPSPGQDPGISEILCWAPYSVPSPLRTEMTARAVLRGLRRIRHYSPSQIKAEITGDRHLQARLRGEPGPGQDEPLPPLTVACVLDEAVLLRRRGPTSVMTAQLDQLGQVARLPGVDLQVLPLDADGPAVDTAYTILGHQDELADIVLLDGPAGAEETDDSGQVTDYRFAFEDLQRAAADTEESLELIKRAADRWAG